MAGILGVSAEAAQKRVNRAVDRLREIFSKRGLAVGAGALATIVSANATQAAPAGLAAAISSASLVGSATAVTTTAKIIVMTTLQKTLVTTTIVAVTAAGLYQANQVTQLRRQVQTLQGQLAEAQQSATALQTQPAPVLNSPATAAVSGE